MEGWTVWDAPFIHFAIQLMIEGVTVIVFHSRYGVCHTACVWRCCSPLFSDLKDKECGSNIVRQSGKPCHPSPELPLNCLYVGQHPESLLGHCKLGHNPRNIFETDRISRTELDSFGKLNSFRKTGRVRPSRCCGIIVRSKRRGRPE